MSMATEIISRDIKISLTKISINTIVSLFSIKNGGVSHRFFNLSVNINSAGSYYISAGRYIFNLAVLCVSNTVKEI